MNKKKISLDSLLQLSSIFDGLDDEDTQWLATQPRGREIIIDDYTDRQTLVRLASLKLRAAIKSTEDVTQLLRTRLSDIEVESEPRLRRALIVIEAASEMFSGDETKATSWCATPLKLKLLEGVAPLDMIDSDDELNLILNNITRIQDDTAG